MPARTDDTTKRCSGCDQALPLTAFHKGRRGKCKTCRSAEYMRDREANREYRRQQYAEKREEYNARSRAWYEANRDRHRATGRAWEEAHADEVRAYRATYYRDNIDRWVLTDEQRARVVEAARRRRATDPEYYRAKGRAREARKRGQFVETIIPLAVLEADDGVCGICGGDLDPFDFHVDHVIPLARGGEHSYANVQVAHPLCNWRKRDEMPEVV